MVEKYMKNTRLERNPLELSEALNDGSAIVIKQLSDAGIKNVSKVQAKGILALPIRNFLTHTSFSILQKPKARRQKVVVVIRTK